MSDPAKNHCDNSMSGDGDKSDLAMDSDKREISISCPADSPDLAESKDAAKMLHEREERHERLIKLSHEITVEYNKVKVLFHAPTIADSSDNTVTEMQELIQKLINGPIKSIGLELEECCLEEVHGDAVTVGFQEYAQARIMLSLMTDMIIVSYKELQNELEYNIIDNENERLLVTRIPESDYMLGLADITGELMKKVINSISNGDTEECFVASGVLVELCSWYLNEAGDDSHLLDSKLPEIRANMFKVEQALYGLCERGGEMPPHRVLARTLSELGELGNCEDLVNHSDNDEGYDYY